MKIIDRLKEDKIHISFEVFPPKTDAGFEKVIAATDAMAKLNPAFISVTYGAGGGTSKNTAKIAYHIKDDLGVVSLAVGLSNICYTPINKFPQNSLW